MSFRRLSLLVLPDLLAVVRLEKGADIPDWATRGDFFSITRTGDELSVVCPTSLVPAGSKCERDWRCLRVAGTQDFALVGVLASLVAPLAEGGISVFALSTFDTDYLLVKESDFERALTTLRHAGHTVAS